MQDQALPYVRPATLLIFLLLLVSYQPLALQLEPRGNSWSCCIGGTCDDDAVDLDQTEYNDGPTSDKAAGMGVEFETAAIRFIAPGCSQKDTNAAKGKIVANRQGLNWRLTADSTPIAGGDLAAEYILDGTEIKIGTGAAVAAARAVVHDINIWNPFKDMPDNEFSIEDNNCNPWHIGSPDTGGGANEIAWAPQITAPMPLEALHDLFAKAVADQPSDLLPTIHRFERMVCVTKEFFQSSPNDLRSESVTEDVLGFFSLLMSYAKGARTEDEGDSPKKIISIMPRTDFTTIFKQVKTRIPGKLYDIVKVLGCYKNSGANVELDTKYCSGTVESPQPNRAMDEQTFRISNAAGVVASCTVQEWIESVERGDSPDRLAKLDETFCSQIGHLKDALEKVLDSTRAVPLFEFRRLKRAYATTMVDRVRAAEQTIIDYHKKHLRAPHKRVILLNEKIGEQSGSVTCSSVASKTTTSFSTSSTRSSSPEPTFAIYLSNFSIPIGDANNKNDGADLRDNVFHKLRALCPDSAHTCDNKTLAEIDNVPTVVGKSPSHETLTFTIEASVYQDANERDRMIAAAVATWQQAISRSCKQVEYTDTTSSQCGAGPVKRVGCTYHASLCASPGNFSPGILRSGKASDSYMNIELAFKLKGDGKEQPAVDDFDCDHNILDGLASKSGDVAEKLAGKDVWGTQTFGAICDNGWMIETGG